MDLSKQQNHSTSEAANKMRELYNQSPYPEILAEKKPQGFPLMEHWINSFARFHTPVLHQNSNILVAGCGSGHEAIMLAKTYKNATIVGVDFSEQSIEIAKSLAKNENITNVQFDVLDLTTNNWPVSLHSFDFVLCHGVSNYVSDATAMLNNLANSIHSHGLIYMSMNTQYHPTDRIKEAFRTLGKPTSSYEDTAENRELIQAIAKLMGNQAQIENLGEATKTYLNVDIFPPINNHYSIKKWCKKAENAGLKLRGSMESLDSLCLLPNKGVSHILGLRRDELALWMIKLRARAGMHILFGKQSTQEPDFSSIEKLGDWRPKLAEFVGAIPSMEGKFDKELPLTLQFHGHADYVIYSTGFDLEVFRRCNGILTIREILESIPAIGNITNLQWQLFRAFHYGVLVG